MDERRFLTIGLICQVFGALGVWMCWPGQVPARFETAGMLAFLAAVGLVWVGALLCLVWAVAGGVRRGLQGTVATIKVPGSNLGIRTMKR